MMTALCIILLCAVVFLIITSAAFFRVTFFTIPTVIAVAMFYGCCGLWIGTLLSLPALVLWGALMRGIYIEWKWDRLMRSDGH